MTQAAEAMDSRRGAALWARVVAAAATALGRLPEAPLVAAAEALGEAWYRLAPGRAAQARANLRRVCEHLAATGRGTTLARRAATDPAALEQLVRAAFRHTVRYYLEVARAPRTSLATAIERLEIETPAEVEAGLASGRPIVIVGLHFGAIELPVVYVRSLTGYPVTAPMETIANPGLQRWFVASRSVVGVSIIPIRDARRRMLTALRAGESVGMVADRDLTGGGIPVPLFGHVAPIPAGPALLALEAGVPLFVGGVRRVRDRRYRGRLLEVPAPKDGSRRQQLHELTAGIAAAMEEIIEDAPEQWWGCFHPIWPDLAINSPEPLEEPAP